MQMVCGLLAAAFSSSNFILNGKFPSHTWTVPRVKIFGTGQNGEPAEGWLGG